MAEEGGIHFGASVGGTTIEEEIAEAIEQFKNLGNTVADQSERIKKLGGITASVAAAQSAVATRLVTTNNAVQTLSDELSDLARIERQGGELTAEQSKRRAEATVELEQQRVAARNLRKELGSLIDAQEQLNAAAANTTVAATQQTQAAGALNTKFDTLGFSIQQMARELPALAYGPQIFFSAISNNLPMLADEIKRVRLEIVAAKKAGDSFVPLGKQIASSIFSWQTALIAAITVLTMFGDEIIRWIGNIFKGKKAVDSLKMSVEQYKAVMQGGVVAAQEELTEAELLYKAATKVTNSYDDRRKAAEKLISLYPDYLQGLNEEMIMTGEAYDAYGKLINRLVELEQARRAVDKIVDNREIIAAVESTELWGQIVKLRQKILDKEIELATLEGQGFTARVFTDPLKAEIVTLNDNIKRAGKEIYKILTDEDGLNLDVPESAKENFADFVDGVRTSIAELEKSADIEVLGEYVDTKKNTDKIEKTDKIEQERIALRKRMIAAEQKAIKAGITDRVELLKKEKEIAVQAIEEEMAATNDAIQKGYLERQKIAVTKEYDIKIAAEVKTQKEAEEQALKELLEDVQTYEQRRLAIQQEYAEKRALLYEKDSETLKEGVTQGNVEALNRNEVDALAEIDEEFANRSIVFQEWVNSIADASLTQLGYYLADAQAMLMDMEEDMPGDETLAKLRASIALLDAEIAKRRAAEKMGNTSDKSAEKTNRSVEEWSELRETLNDVSRELDQIGDEIGGVGGEIIKTAGVVATNTVSLISDISRLSEISADNIEGTSEVAAEAIAKVERASVILAILSAALKVAKAIGDAINGDKRKDRRINGLTDDINDLKKSYEQLQKATESTYSSAASKGLEAQNDNLEKQKKLVEDQIKLEQDKKHTSHDRLKEMRAELDALNEQIAANKVAMSDAIFGEDIQSSIGNLTAALLDAWEQGDNKVKASKDVVKNMIKSMISEAMKLDVKGFMENLRSKMEEFWNDGYISSKEEDILEQMAEEEAKRIDSKYQWADKYLKGVADKAEQSATFGGFETMSETTGTKLDGRFATMVMLEEDIKNGAIELVEINTECRNLLCEANNIAIDTRDIQVEQLNYLKIIASNTDRLENIETELGNISRYTKNLE